MFRFLFIAGGRICNYNAPIALGIAASTVVGGVLACIAGFFIFFESVFTVDFYSTVLASSPQTFRVFSAQSSVLTQLFIVAPWLFFILPATFDIDDILRRLGRGVTDAWLECELLLNQTVFSDRRPAVPTAGDVALVVVVASILLPIFFGVAVCVYIVYQLRICMPGVKSIAAGVGL